jgi:ABC-2 type transport system permease protein
MRIIRVIIEKEFKQVFRNKMMLPIIFVMPIFQLLVLSYTATFEIKNIDVGIINMDQSQYSRELISKFKGSPFFNIKTYNFNIKELEEQLKHGEIDQIINIPNNFGNDIANNKNSKINIVTDAVNGSAASLMAYYASSIIMDFNSDILIDKNLISSSEQGIKTSYQFWYNSELDYKKYMVPGILVLLVTMIGSFMSGMNIVKEKEIGTIEQLNVTPIKKHEFIIGKLLPFWIIAMFDLILGLLLARFVFDIHIQGNIILVMGVASIYLLAVLGLGLLISTVTDTQQQAMFIAWFFMVIFIMLSGLFTPVEAMPDWANMLNYFNPITYFIRFMRQVMLKGSGLMDVIDDVIGISIYAVSVLSLAVIRYKKVS